MATSSIFHNVVIRTSEEANAFVEAMVKMADDPSYKIKTMDTVVTDPERIRKIVETRKWKKKNMNQ